MAKSSELAPHAILDAIEAVPPQVEAAERVRRMMGRGAGLEALEVAERARLMLGLTPEMEALERARLMLGLTPEMEALERRVR